MGLFSFFSRKSTAPANINVDEAPGTVCAPVGGRVIAMPNLPDPVFSDGIMGEAIGIEPEQGVAYAPISGTVQAVMPHAFGIKGEGIEILLHIGVDTVKMNGDGFDVHVSKGQEVKAGDILVTFDRAKVAAAGYPDTVMVIVSNTAEVEAIGKHVEPVALGVVAAGAPLFLVSERS